MKKAISLLICISFIFGLCACKGDSFKTPSTVNLTDMNGDSVEIISDRMYDNGFDGRFISFVAENTDGNFLVSPLSFRYALGLVLAGAKGNTETELLNALGVKSADEWTRFCTKFNGFAKQFNEKYESEIENYKKCNDVEELPIMALRVANSVWKREDIEADFKSAYKEYIEKNFGAEYNTFTRKNAVKKINTWVNENLAVVLMNALYYKNNWQILFDKSSTCNDDFKTKSGKTVTKQFMVHTDSYKYYSDDKTQAVILPMRGGVNMAFVLGDTSNIAKKITKAESKQVTVKIPKIDIETTLGKKEMVDFLKENGVRDAFDRKKADFSKMIDHKIWIDDIIQKTKIKTDENGVEAAAVTAVVFGDMAAYEPANPIEFTADRPFSFYIYTTCDDITATLFAGAMAE